MWHIETSVSLIVLGPFLIGLLVGTAGSRLARARPARPAPSAPAGSPDGET
jgi:hypothetical protein